MVKADCITINTEDNEYEVRDVEIINLEKLIENVKEEYGKVTSLVIVIVT